MVMDSKLFVKVSQREERVDRIEAFLVFPVAAFHFSVMPWGVRTDELVPDAKISGSLLKNGGPVVPRRCIADPELHLFQYTAIDEFSRLRFLAAYPEQSRYALGCKDG